MKTRIVTLGIVAMIAAGQVAGVPQAQEEGRTMLTLEDLTITVVYDNNPHGAGLRAAWGFSCLIEGAGRLILFDTGGDAPVLLSNMDSLSIDPRDIEIVVLSHKHEDHTGGMMALLEVNPNLTVFVPGSFSGDFKKRLEDGGAGVVEVEEPVEIAGGVYSLGQLGSLIKEQSLALVTDRGLIVITGCAHPGIVDIVKRAREVTGREVLLAMGGFHLVRAGEDELSEVLAGFREAGVAYAAPCHCSGDGARQAFASAYGDNYIELGVGAVINGSAIH